MRLTPDCETEPCHLQPLPEPNETYCLLDPWVCQCTAAANSTPANMVELERHWARIIIECDSRYVQRNMRLQRDLLSLHASSLRNKAAAGAAEACYRLASLEAREKYLDLAIEEIEKSVRRVEKFEAAGLPIEVDDESLSTRLNELRDQRLQLQFARIQINGQLQQLLGCEICEANFYLPQVDWTPDLTPVDACVAVTEGLNYRHDIRGLDLLLCKLEKSTLRVARGVLAVADGTLGSVEPTEGWIHRLRCICCNDAEVGVRCKQLSMLHDDTQRLATAQIKNAVYEVTMQQQRIVLARKSVQQRRQRLLELQAKRDVEEVPVFEISQARGAVYEAESHLIEQVAALKIARVHLRMAQGRIVYDCGYPPQLCSEGCCDGACTKCQPPTCKQPLCPCP
jgi:hypothetical protein